MCQSEYSGRLNKDPIRTLVAEGNNSIKQFKHQEIQQKLLQLEINTGYG